MRFNKFEIGSNPYIGVYACVSNEFGVFPQTLRKAQRKIAEDVLGVKVLLRNVSESTINGVVAKIFNNKILLSGVADDRDVKFFENEGLDVLKLKSNLAVGNLTAINNSGLLLSEEYSDDEIKEIEEFFSKKAHVFNLSNISIVGSCIALNNNHIAMYPHIKQEEFEYLQNIFSVSGNVATVNYGDGFVGNGLLLNDKGVLIGKLTTGFEIIRIDDIFGR